MKTVFYRLTMAIVPWLAARLMRLLAATMRIERIGWENVEPLIRQHKHLIAAFWHGRLLMVPLLSSGREMRVLVSRSKDGELIARTAAHLGSQVVRGSSSRGGFSAMREILRHHKRGVDFAVTPDGPRGPRHLVQPGVIEMAKRTGLPIIPLTFSARKKKLFAPGTAF